MIFVYKLGPIDFWNGWLSAADFVAETENVDANYNEETFLPFVEKAQDLARGIGWEGDMRSGPFVSALPNPDSGNLSDFILAWKQDNNGTTFVASPYELPWLGRPTARG
ncbi:hypothetical protein C6558_36235 [Ensifer sp. NM-2]|uniref:hypothetical protein n=1 Tax=Ensifer sp. NM-2 TaxID=2109730 RepID=UPI000D13E25D|nr:hypothetical protein [Ensifer sp. NM-2]PSS59873.1 hypothetical protein C6558_36235 [Ensifer sp. NM-2]